MQRWSHSVPRKSASLLRQHLGVLSWVIALTLLSGCAGYMANRADVAQRVEAMLKDQRYQQALDTIALVESDHADYRRLQGWRPTIETNMARYERASIAEVDDMTLDDRWHNAGLRLREALERLPKSAALQRRRESFERQRDEYLGEQRRTLMLARGRGLPGEIAALELLVRATPEDREQTEELERRRTMLSQAQRELVRCGRTALAAGQNQRANECLVVASSIGQSNEINRLIAASNKTTEARQRKVEAAAQKREVRNQARRVEEYKIAFRSALKNGDLLGARNNVRSILQLQPTAAWRQEKSRVDERISQQVKRSLADGRELYIQGDFAGARTVWMDALPLAPDNRELRANIERAERVLKKLQTLSSDQQTDN